MKKLHTITAILSALLSFVAVHAHAEQANAAAASDSADAQSAQRITTQMDANHARVMQIKPSLWISAGAGSDVRQNFGFEYHLQGNTSLIAGTYRHDNERSRYFAVTYTPPLQLGPVQFGLNVGAIDGYQSRHEGRYQAFIAPVVTLTYQSFGVNVTSLQSHDGHPNGTLVVQFKAKVY